MRRIYDCQSRFFATLRMTLSEYTFFDDEFQDDDLGDHMDQQSRTLLESVLALPTMSFHETAVATFVKWYAAGLALEVKEDKAGNILVRYRGAGASKRAITFAAHLDHPGFEVVSASSRKAVLAQWGKVDLKVVSGARVRVHTEEGVVHGRLGKKPLARKHDGRATFAATLEAPVKAGDFGTFDLPAVYFEDGQIYALAADNLMSVSAILDLMTRFVKGKAKVNVTGLFTRGEEAGFLGAFAAMEHKLIPCDDPLIVLECSSAKGGNVGIGNGPVVRVGDLASTYDPAVEVWISEVARRVSEKNDFEFQRALLSGGRCEACVYIAAGYACGGIALPLGNYHNQGARGPAAEYVSQSDYAHLLTLMAALAHHPYDQNIMAERVRPIREHYQGLAKKLHTTA